MAITIRIRYSDDAMWGAAGHEGYDVAESFECFEHQVTAALKAYNPTWAVTFEQGINDDLAMGCDTMDEYAREHEIQNDAADVMHTVWESWRWAVAA